MEISHLPSLWIALTTILIALALSGAWRVLNWVWLRPKRLEQLLRQQGFDGKPYRFLFGDVKEHSKLLSNAQSTPIGLSDDFKARIFPFLYKTVKTYGKDSFMWIGPSPRVNIAQPEHIKDILTKMYDFKKPPSNPMVRLLSRGITSHEGDKWAMHRKIINPAFHQEKLKLMLPAFYSSCNTMVTAWEELVSNNELFELDVWPDLKNLTRDVISRTAFGSSFEEGKRIFELQTEQAKLVDQYLRTVYIPGWRFIPTAMNRRMKNIAKEIGSLLKGIISKKEKAMRAGDGTSDDLLGQLLESNMREIRSHKGDKNVGMSINDVIEECKLFYFAGQETTSTLLVWTMHLLSIHTQWQERAREEVLQVFGRNKPDMEGLNHLKIVTMILNEVMRLYPPVVMLVRSVYKDMKLGKLIIPAGVLLALPTLLIHHDQELWGVDAMEFKPERFAEGISKATKGQMTFLPFGWGPRICVGQNFAMIEAKMALAMILQRFSFEISPSYIHAPTTMITLQPQHGVQVLLRRKEC